MTIRNYSTLKRQDLSGMIEKFKSFDEFDGVPNAHYTIGNIYNNNRRVVRATKNGLVHLCFGSTVSSSSHSLFQTMLFNHGSSHNSLHGLINSTPYNMYAMNSAAVELKTVVFHKKLTEQSTKVVADHMSNTISEMIKETNTASQNWTNYSIDYNTSAVGNWTTATSQTTGPKGFTSGMVTKNALYNGPYNTNTVSLPNVSTATSNNITISATGPLTVNTSYPYNGTYSGTYKNNSYDSSYQFESVEKYVAIHNIQGLEYEIGSTVEVLDGFGTKNNHAGDIRTLIMFPKEVRLAVMDAIESKDSMDAVLAEHNLSNVTVNTAAVSMPAVYKGVSIAKKK